ncbi:uncharacterized protein LOC111405492 [Olea europaea var. sylvestris]|uniref:uncharacterized protein LOC111405492 n=1 Tax=Olea europaea var. sylvestris TaxID=158386 RepID=UPI000C1CE0B6|nr:uncharacterized protein LOC111405492 [Olea europaea var. sylvestris]
MGACYRAYIHEGDTPIQDTNNITQDSFDEDYILHENSNPQSEEEKINVINRIQLQKWYYNITIVVNKEFKFTSSVLIDSGANQNYLIRPSKSLWSCFSFYINNSTKIERGVPRFVINYKPLNKVLQWIRYSLPQIKDLLIRLYKAAIFSKFDMKSGFWQIQIKEEDKYKTTFNIPFEKYEWNFMSFDYVLIFSESIEQHFKHLNVFIHVVKNNGLSHKHTIVVQKVKQAIKNIPCILIIDPLASIIVEKDASDIGYDGMLKQNPKESNQKQFVRYYNGAEPHLGIFGQPRASLKKEQQQPAAFKRRNKDTKDFQKVEDKSKWNTKVDKHYCPPRFLQQIEEMFKSRAQKFKYKSISKIKISSSKSLHGISHPSDDLIQQLSTF